MKRFNIAGWRLGVAALALVAFAGSCSPSAKDDIEVAGYFEMSEESTKQFKDGVDVDYHQKTVTFNFKTNYSWKASVVYLSDDEGWCSVRPAEEQSDGETSFDLVIDQNEGQVAREATLKLTAGEYSGTMSIKQASSIFFEVSSDEDLSKYPAAGGMIQIKVRANVPYTQTVSTTGKDWIKHAETQPDETDPYTHIEVYKVYEYDNEESPRSASIEFKGEGIRGKKTMVINQKNRPNPYLIADPGGKSWLLLDMENAGLIPAYDNENPVDYPFKPDGILAAGTEVSSIVDNPNPSGINTSGKCVIWNYPLDGNGGVNQWWEGGFAVSDNTKYIDLTRWDRMSFDVYYESDEADVEGIYEYRFYLGTKSGDVKVEVGSQDLRKGQWHRITVYFKDLNFEGGNRTILEQSQSFRTLFNWWNWKDKDKQRIYLDNFTLERDIDLGEQ